MFCGVWTKLVLVPFVVDFNTQLCVGLHVQILEHFVRKMHMIWGFIESQLVRTREFILFCVHPTCTVLTACFGFRTRPLYSSRWVQVGRKCEQDGTTSIRFWAHICAENAATFSDLDKVVEQTQKLRDDQQQSQRTETAVATIGNTLKYNCRSNSRKTQGQTMKGKQWKIYHFLRRKPSAGDPTETIPKYSNIFPLWTGGGGVSTLKSGRCADAHGILAEIFVYPDENLQCLLGIFNRMIVNNTFNPAWYRTLLTTLPTTGGSSKPS